MIPFLQCDLMQETSFLCAAFPFPPFACLTCKLFRAVTLSHYVCKHLPAQWALSSAGVFRYYRNTNNNNDDKALGFQRLVTTLVGTGSDCSEHW